MEEQSNIKNNIKRTLSEETKRKISETEKGKIISEETKKLLKVTSKRVWEEQYENKEYTPFHKEWWTPEKRLEHSNRMKQVVKDNPESYSSENVCGRVKVYIYNDIKLNGRWELEYAKYLDFNNIKWCYY